MSESQTISELDDTLDRRGKRRAVRVDVSKRDDFVRRFGLTPPAPQQGVQGVAQGPAQGVAQGVGPVVLPPLPAVPQGGGQAFAAPAWDGGVAVKKAFKGSAQKKTCLIEVGGTEYVLKGAPRVNGMGNVADRANRSTAEDNAAAASFIRKLGLDGVRAPAIRMVDGAERGKLVAALQAVANAGGPGAADAQDLVTSLQTGDAQLSELNQGGEDSDKIFIDRGIADGRADAQKIRQDNAANPDAAWAAAVGVVKGKTGSKVAQAKLDGYANDTDPAKRQEAVDYAKQTFFNPYVLEVVKVMEDVAKGELAQGLKRGADEAAALAEKQRKVKDFAQSPEGVAAYAGVAAVDLMTGMEDRILGAWNGGNFLVDADAGELVCVDNNKNPLCGLGEPGSTAWNDFFIDAVASRGSSLADVIFDKIYGATGETAADRPAAMPGFAMDDAQAVAAKATIRTKLEEVVRAVEADGAAPQAAKERAAFIKETMALQDVFAVPPEVTSIDAVPEPDLSEKLLRGIKRVGSSWYDGAKKIKESLRAHPDQAAAALTALDQLIQKHPNNSKGGDDRLAEHLRFLARACQFGVVLRQKAAQLQGLAGPAKFPDGPKATKLLNDLPAPLMNEAASWRGKLTRKDDAAIVATIAAGEAALTQAFAQRRARYTAG